jgi:uncharacterized oxidoreductase
MKTTGNTILITGGGSGIGRGLAEAFQKLGNQVVIAGRRQEALDEVTAANYGMQSAVLDIEDPASIRDFGTRMAHDFPALNVVVHNAGIMRPENVQGPTRLPGRRRGHRRHQPARPDPPDGTAIPGRR